MSDSGSETERRGADSCGQTRLPCPTKFLTCANAAYRPMLAVVRSVRDEKAAGSCPSVPTGKPEVAEYVATRLEQIVAPPDRRHGRYRRPR